MFFSRKKSSWRKESRRHSADTQATKQNERAGTRRSFSDDSLDSCGTGDEKRSSISLFDIFPKHVAEALRDGKEVEPEQREVVTIFFSDIVGFTDISSTLPPRKVATMLDRLYQKFDELSHKHDIFKVETIGDAYMAVTNLVKDQPDHAKRIADFSIAAIEAANSTLIDEDNPDQGCVNIRVGFHSGPVVADVVGTRNPRYCLFGDTVNTASRMESNSIKNRIHCSEAAAGFLRKQHFEFPIIPRGVISVKGKGDMFTYWIKERGEEERQTATITTSTTTTTANSPALSGTGPRRDSFSRRIITSTTTCGPPLRSTVQMRQNANRNEYNNNNDNSLIRLSSSEPLHMQTKSHHYSRPTPAASCISSGATMTLPRKSRCVIPNTPPKRFESDESPHRCPYRPNRNDHLTNNSNNDVVRQNYSDEPTPSSQPAPSSSPRPMIAVAPGLELPLRSTEETLRAIRFGNILSTECMLCTLKIFCMKEANFILCPECRTVGPASEGEGGGIGLGFTQAQYDQWRMET